MMIALEIHNGLFPTPRHTDIAATTTSLTPAVAGSNLIHLNAIHLFHRMLDLNLIGVFVDLKTVRTTDIREVHALLRDQRFNYDIVFIHSHDNPNNQLHCDAHLFQGASDV